MQWLAINESKQHELSFQTQLLFWGVREADYLKLPEQKEDLLKHI